jgi:DUF971 family protein
MVPSKVMLPPTLTEARRIPEARHLRLTWSDGHSVALDYNILRGFCPCAGCQGHNSTEVVFYAPRQNVDLVGIQPVGNYGLSLLFSDGHGTGIYRFDYLRRIDSGERMA